MVDASTGDVAAQFRHKSTYMRTWKPASTPSNRDRLELYALHKQAVSGDAPSSLSTQTGAERAKYQAWRQKNGLSQEEAMRLYIQESERQVRVYGLAAANSTPQTPMTTPAALDGQNGTSSGASTSGSSTAAQPRGLAAIPLLCAAASESRQAYLRRLANTQPEQAWWGRQEALCATPGSIWALPESTLIGVAALLERLSLSSDDQGRLLAVLPAPVVQSFLWPWHNCLLALWMGLILAHVVWTAALELATTVVWGSRRTGLSLPSIWKDEIQWSSRQIQTLTESHQPLSARLVGLALTPYVLLVAVTGVAPPQSTAASLLYVALVAMTWWYWWLVLPWMGVWMLGLATVAGGCFFLIELAGS